MPRALQFWAMCAKEAVSGTLERSNAWFWLMCLASADRRSEDIGVLPVVVAELELRDIERQILVADLVESAHDTALNQRPKTFNRVCVNGADHVMPVAVPDDAMRIALAEPVISREIVGTKQADLCG